MVFYYAATVDLEEMECDLEQPQSCNSTEVSSVNLATGVVGVSLNSLILMTTAALTIVRAIQIKFPFYQLKKSLVLVILFSFIVVQAAIWYFIILSPFGVKYFLAATYMSLSTTPFGKLDDDDLNFNLIYSSSLPILAAQLLTVLASVLTGVTLFLQQKCNTQSALVKSRRSGTLKVMLTNVPSLAYAVLFSTPVSALFISGKEVENGWVIFWLSNVLPPFSSVWNPVVFISLTPKSREHIMSLLAWVRA